MHRTARLSADLDSRLIDALRDPAGYPHPVRSVELIETHISWLLLTDELVYKIKKPIKLDFLDFSTLDRRRFYCNEEIRLNQPWAPDIYLDVVPITECDGRPRIAGEGAAVEYAVRMRRFEQDLRLDRQLELGRLSAVDMHELGHNIASRHAAAEIVPAGKRDEYLVLTKEFMSDNFRALDGFIEQAELDRLRQWTEREVGRLDELLARRFDDGFVRDCHGDLHLANLVRLHDGITTFDCIEFSEDLRHIDVICDIAFLVMDLVEKERHDLAAHFLNRYLECSGDYAGVALLSLFFVYRCLVRAKVAVIRSREREVADDSRADLAEAEKYCDMAGRQTAHRLPLLVVMSGLSGSGKTRVAHELLAALPAIRIRSDIERKRMFGLRETEDSGSAVGAGIYTAAAGRDVYARLMDSARRILHAGHNVIIDAAFLHKADRTAALQLAQDCDCAAVIVEVNVPVQLLRERIRHRGAGASEAGLEVLEHQLATADPIDEAERDRTIVFENLGDIDVAELLGRIEHGANI